MKITIEIATDARHVLPYPTSQILTGEISSEDYVSGLADDLYNEYVCDRRFSPRAVVSLLAIAIARRGHNPAIELTQ